MSTNYNPKIVKDGLVLCLDAANSKSYPGTGTTWTDLSGNGNNGTLINGPIYSSDNLGSINFDGVDDYVITATSFNTFGNNIGSGFTISVWVKTTTTQSKSLFGTSNDGINVVIGLSFNYGISNKNDQTIGALQMYLRTSTGAYLVGSVQTDIYDGEWHNLVWRQPNPVSNQIYCYIDGVEQQITYTDTTITAATNTWSNFQYPLVIGGGNNRGAISSTYCSLSSFFAYNRVLSADEIAQNFNAQRGRYGI